MEFETVVATLNSLLRTKQPNGFDSSWIRRNAPSPNFSPIEKNKAALRGIKVVSPNSYAQGEERPYGNTVYTRTNGISAVGASFSDRQI